MRETSNVGKSLTTGSVSGMNPSNENVTIKDVDSFQKTNRFDLCNEIPIVL